MKGCGFEATEAMVKTDLHLYCCFVQYFSQSGIPIHQLDSGAKTILSIPYQEQILGKGHLHDARRSKDPMLGGGSSPPLGVLFCSLYSACLL